MRLSKPFTRKIKDAALGSAETVWAAGFAATGSLFPHSVAHWSSAGGQRILVIAPHPDDEAIGCGGTILRHKQSGDTVLIVYVTDGRKSRALGLGPEEMALRRRQEAEAGARALKADHIEWLGLAEGDWSLEHLQSPLLGLLNQFSPHIIYAPSRVDFHPEHHKVAYVTATLLPCSEGKASLSLIRVYQTHVPLTSLLTNLVVDTSSVVAEAAAAIKIYATQSNSVIRTFRQRRYAARFYKVREQAEEFWQMSAREYGLLHSSNPDRWSAKVFRGIRFRSFSDPLAYLIGATERRQLAALTRNQTRQRCVKIANRDS